MTSRPTLFVPPPADFARPLAFALAAVIMLVPANFLPVLSTESAGSVRTDTIASGIKGLYQSGLWPLAVIVATASLVVPFAKIVGLLLLVHAARRPLPAGRARRWTRVYATLEFIGRWSMLDVFLGSFLTSAVRFGALSTIRAQSGIIAFAAAVVLTILATKSFDPRTLWRGIGDS